MYPTMDSNTSVRPATKRVTGWMLDIAAKPNSEVKISRDTQRRTNPTMVIIRENHATAC